MSVRRACAQQFYPGDCQSQIERFLKGYKVPDEPVKSVAGVVPHAGWIFSGAVAAKVFKSITAGGNPETFVLLGAVHTWGHRGNSLYARGSWETPLGEVKIDEELSALLLDRLSGDIVEDPSAHDGEHSIEVQLPFIRYLCPDAKILPISVPPHENAPLTGKKIGEVLSGLPKKIVVIGTTDLTHYGDAYGFTPYGYGSQAKELMRDNDRKMIELILSMKSGAILKEAELNRNACGPGALAATVSAATSMGAGNGHLIEYTTSYDVMPEGDFRMAVGYAGIVF